MSISTDVLADVTRVEVEPYGVQFAVRVYAGADGTEIIIPREMLGELRGAIDAALGDTPPTVEEPDAE